LAQFHGETQRYVVDGLPGPGVDHERGGAVPNAAT
jgi:hypothetical protein